MSSTITVKIATLTATVTSAKTDLETGQIIKWFLQDKVTPPDPSMSQAAQNQYYLDAACSELARHIRQEAGRNRLKELKAAQQSIDDQAAADVAL